MVQTRGQARIAKKQASVAISQRRSSPTSNDPNSEDEYVVYHVNENPSNEELAEAFEGRSTNQTPGTTIVLGRDDYDNVLKPLRGTQTGTVTVSASNVSSPASTPSATPITEEGSASSKRHATEPIDQPTSTPKRRRLESEGTSFEPEALSPKSLRWCKRLRSNQAKRKAREGKRQVQKRRPVYDGFLFPLEPEPRSLMGRMRVHRERQAAVKNEAARVAALEAERMAGIEAERLAVIEAERITAIEAERLAAIEAERIATFEVERIAAIEAERAASLRSLAENGPVQSEPQLTNAYGSVTEVTHTSLSTTSTSEETTQAIPDLPAQAETQNRDWGLIGMLGSAVNIVPRLRRHLYTIFEASPNQDGPQAASTLPPPQPMTQSGRAVSRARRIKSMTAVQRKAIKEQKRVRNEANARAKLSEKLIADEVERQVQERLIAYEGAQLATTGQKRKQSSPTTIPNPKGCSYGMDLDFFGDSSSDEDETCGSDDSPSLRVTKRPRLAKTTPSVPNTPDTGDQHRPRPYVGAPFNIFTEAASMPGVVLGVPVFSSHNDQPTTPLPPPTLSPATLPAENLYHALPSGDNAALERARSQALKYTPKHPSSLRTSVRLSSSPMVSPAGEVFETLAANPATAALIPAAVTVSEEGIARNTVDSDMMQLGKDKVINSDHLDPPGEDVTTNPKILAQLNACCTPEVMESNRRMIAADFALWMLAAANDGNNIL